MSDDVPGAAPSPVPGETVGLNHAVLWVRDPARSSAFYQRVLGLVELGGMPGAVFLKAPASPNDHDLALFATNQQAPPPRSPGLYHLAWEVPTLGALRAVRERLGDALVGASDHALTKSLYAKDPDGIEFEVMWQVPIDADERSGTDIVPTRPLDLDAEIERFGPDRLGGWQELVSRAGPGR